MSPTSVLIGFALSLAANVLLLGYCRGLTRENAKPPSPTPASARIQPLAAVPTAINPETWRELAAGRANPDFAAQLRAKGFPPAIVRELVTVRIREEFAARYQPIYDAAASAPYWKGGMMTMVADPKLELARRALDREVEDRVAQLLGPSTRERTGEQQAEHQRRYGDLAPEKITALERLNADYIDLNHQVGLEARGFPLPEDDEKRALLEKERRADLARLLTPAELEAYDLRSSRTAVALRSRLAAFEPTEQEFRVLFKFTADLDARFGPSNSPSGDRRRERAEAEKALVPQIEAALGPQRYSDYLRARPRSTPR